VALPAVVCLEMARAAIENATASKLSAETERRVLELFNVVWAEDVPVAANQPVNVALFARDDDQVDYEIYTRQEEGDVVHFQGQSVRSTEPAPEVLDIDRLQAEIQQLARSSSNFYSSLGEADIGYGPTYRAITQISSGERQLLAEITVPDSTAAWALQPIVMDCALQAAFDLIPREQQPSKPLAMESVRVLAPCSERMFAWARYAQPGESTEPMNIQLDIDLCDRHGNVAVQMRGVTYELVRDVPADITESIDCTDVEGT